MNTRNLIKLNLLLVASLSLPITAHAGELEDFVKAMKSVVTQSKNGFSELDDEGEKSRITLPNFNESTVEIGEKLTYSSDFSSKTKAENIYQKVKEFLNSGFSGTYMSWETKTGVFQRGSSFAWVARDSSQSAFMLSTSKEEVTLTIYRPAHEGAKGTAPTFQMTDNGAMKIMKEIWDALKAVPARENVTKPEEIKADIIRRWKPFNDRLPLRPQSKVTDGSFMPTWLENASDVCRFTRTEPLLNAHYKFSAYGIGEGHACRWWTIENNARWDFLFGFILTSDNYIALPQQIPGR